mgnify:CR=1 FL=1
MARINLLPWREEARRERQRQFLYNLMGTLVLGAILVLLVGMFLIYSAVTTAVVRRRREIGILRAIGLSRGGIRRLFLFEAERDAQRPVRIVVR